MYFFVILVMFLFGFEDPTLVLTASVPGHCLPFNFCFDGRLLIMIVTVPGYCFLFTFTVRKSDLKELRYNGRVSMIQQIWTTYVCIARVDY